jgi:hypothetical protein
MEKLRRKIIGKGFPIFSLKKKNGVSLNLITFFLSNLLSVLLVFPEIFMGKEHWNKST